MKKTKGLLLTVTLFGALAACNSEPNPAENENSTQQVDSTSTSSEVAPEEKVVVEKPSEKPKKMKPEHQFVLGKWTGTLRNKKLTIVIESIQGNEVIGYNIAGNNQRPLTGKIMDDDRGGDGECSGMKENYKVILNEPGDDKWDGTFVIYFGDCPEYDEQMENILSHSYSAYGSWKAYSGKLSGDVLLNK